MDVILASEEEGVELDISENFMDGEWVGDKDFGVQRCKYIAGSGILRS